MEWRELEGMTWFDILKMSTEDAIADAKRFAPEEVKEEIREQKKMKYNAYQKLLRRLGRPPSKSELREEMTNPTRLPTGRKKLFGPKRGNFPSRQYKPKFNREYREQIKQRPKKYNFVMSVIDFLNRQNKTIDRPNIIDEMGLSERTLTPDDNEAIDFVLQEMNQ